MSVEAPGQGGTPADRSGRADLAREGASSVRNAALVSLAGYFEAATGLVVGVVIARTLGPDQFGVYAFAVWICGWLILASNHALTSSSIKFIAEQRGAGHEDVARAIMLRLWRLQQASTLVVLVAFVAVSMLDPEVSLGSATFLALAVLAVWARAGFWMLGSFAKGHERFEPENLALAATALANVGAVALVAAAGGSATAFFAVYSTSGLLSLVLVRYLIRRRGITAAQGAIPAATQARLNRHVVQTGFVILLGLMTYRVVEMFILNHQVTVAEVGFFAIAMTLTKGAIDIMSGGIAAVLLPGMARRFGSGGAPAMASILTHSSRIYWIIGIAIAGGGWLVAPGAVVLLYGEPFRAAGTALQGCLVAGGIGVTCGPAIAVLTAGDRQGKRIAINAVTLAVNIAAAVAWIPTHGVPGAVASYAATQLVHLVLVWALALRHAGALLAWGALVRTTLASLLAVAIGWAISLPIDSPWSSLTAGAAFAICYPPLLVACRALRRIDFEVCAELLDRAGHRGKHLSACLRRLSSHYGTGDD